MTWSWKGTKGLEEYGVGGTDQNVLYYKKKF